MKAANRVCIMFCNASQNPKHDLRNDTYHYNYKVTFRNRVGVQDVLTHCFDDHIIIHVIIGQSFHNAC